MTTGDDQRQEHGVEILPVDVNHSRWDCTLEGAAIRLGLRMIVGMPNAQAERIEQKQPFDSIDDVRRSGVSRGTIERLARADAFGSLQLDRRASLWESLRPASTSPLFQDAEDAELPLSLPAMEGREEVFADYQTTGLSLKAHPISFFRTQLNELRIAPANRRRSQYERRARASSSEER